MASGINSTLRQVGLATGVAALGTILASHVRDSRSRRTERHAPRRPRPHDRARRIDGARSARDRDGAPPVPRRRREQAHARRSSSGLNTILLIAAVVAFTGAALSFALIRERDFVVEQEDAGHREYAIAA